MDDLRLDGRVAVVTGAASGIGEATVNRLRELGARVAGLDLASSAAELSLVCDVSDPAAVATALAEVEKRLGAISVLVNSAGVAPPWIPFEEISAERFERVLAVNLRGTFTCTQAAASQLRRAGGGAVVNVASVAGRHRSLSSDAAYTASKGAVIALTRQLAHELAKDGVRVNCVCPGPVDGPLLRANLDGKGLAALAASVPVGRLARPEEVAAVICFLASPAASYMQGAIVDVNGGLL